MYCYKCGCELGRADHCPNCGTDVRTYKKIIYTSNYMYNDGLEKAKVRDLSGAILSLKDAIWFYKDNLDARNLLGLVYYEIGETVAALSEWVISENINNDRAHRKDNPAVRYLKEVQQNRQVTENINTAIRRYNHAIECCYSGNLDVAVLELKKVLNLYPHYLRARQLLSLLYIQKRDYKIAERELQKCKKLDVNNTTTLRYLQEVEGVLRPSVSEERIRRRGTRERTGAEQLPGAENGVVKYTADNETIIQPVGSRKPGVDGFSIPGGIMGGLIGLIVGAALVAFLLMPARVQSIRKESADEVRSISAQLDTKDTTIADLQDQVSSLKAQQAKDAQENSDRAEATDDTRTANDNGLFATANAYINNASDNDTLTDVFVKVDPDTALSGASPEYTDLFNNLYAKLQSPMLERYAWDGINLYEGADPDYEKIISELVIANKYEDPNAWSMTYVERLWYLADSYNKAYNGMSKGDQEKSDYQENAKKYAQMVVANFPDSEYAVQSRQLLTDLGVDVSTLAAPAGMDNGGANGDTAAGTGTGDNAPAGGQQQTTTTTTTRTNTRQPATQNANAVQAAAPAAQNAAPAAQAAAQAAQNPAPAAPAADQAAQAADAAVAAQAQDAAQAAAANQAQAADQAANAAQNVDAAVGVEDQAAQAAAAAAAAQAAAQ